ncbi:ATP-dependent DNA helicase RecQ [Williamsia limnetica]|uniref:ATP-dependent DNA helicase RecQ n=2 Tax=Williamsia limnetica TaxID=882452 RepID=A0A318RG96_WILLI|nr:ATP-dependent DNA helicase RecQ [Williamsia limnetica]
MRGQDTLVIMATGSGKSAVYQVPGIHLNGIVVVISPLIALQHDQIKALEDVGIGAVAINSQQRKRDLTAAWDRIRSGGAQFVFATPEQLTDDEIASALDELNVALLVIDEAHCISAWGHDFRPEYLRLAGVRRALGNPPIAALTATASPPVRQEIIQRLELRNAHVVAGGFDRPEISLSLEHVVDAQDRQRRVVEHILELNGPGLVYAATRKDTHAYADALAQHGLRTASYHAGLRRSARDEVHNAFLADEVDAVVATSAFGMGVDKPNVRYVVHAAAPDSLDTYYQQIGRGGRDGDPTTATLFYRSEDLALARLFTTQRPDRDMLRSVMTALHDDSPQRLTALRKHLGVRGRTYINAINLLERADVLHSTREGLVARDVSVDESIDRAIDITRQGEEFDRTRVEMLREYAETAHCRRQLLLGYFGELTDTACGNCDRCRSGSDTRPTNAGPFDLGAKVEHEEWGTGEVIDTSTDRLTVRFERHGYRTLSVGAVTRHQLLATRSKQ